MHCSFRQNLSNYGKIIGTKGCIELLDFWRGTDARLFIGEECIEEYSDPRNGNGFEHQIQGISQDLVKGLKSPSMVKHEDSLRFQEIMDGIRSKF